MRYGVRLVPLDGFIVPFRPRLHAEMPLERHKQRIFMYPAFVLLNECVNRRAVALKAAPFGRLQHAETIKVYLLVIHAPRVIAPVHAFNLAALKQAVLNKHIKVNKIRIARRGGKALVRRIAVACRPKGQHLPRAPARGLQKIGKPICLAPKRADTVGRRQRKYRH